MYFWWGNSSTFLLFSCARFPGNSHRWAIKGGVIHLIAKHSLLTAAIQCWLNISPYFSGWQGCTYKHLQLMVTVYISTNAVCSETNIRCNNHLMYFSHTGILNYFKKENFRIYSIYMIMYTRHKLHWTFNSRCLAYATNYRLVCIINLVCTNYQPLLRLCRHALNDCTGHVQ